MNLDLLRLLLLLLLGLLLLGLLLLGMLLLLLLVLLRMLQPGVESSQHQLLDVRPPARRALVVLGGAPRVIG